MGSIRMEFKVPALRQQIQKKHEADVAAAREKRRLNEDLPARRQAWRDRAENLVLGLATRLQEANDSVTDNDLEEFRVPKAPTLDTRYGKSPLETYEGEVAKAVDLRDRRLARLEVMTPDAQGSLWLTTSMLYNLFGL